MRVSSVQLGIPELPFAFSRCFNLVLMPISTQAGAGRMAVKTRSAVQRAGRIEGIRRT